MGWNFRKSLKVGPLRVNLSKSGVGCSVGIKGLRIGQDAKGRRYTAASIPGTGVYRRDYQKSVPALPNSSVGNQASQSGGTPKASRNPWGWYVAGALVIYAVLKALS